VGSNVDQESMHVASIFLNCNEDSLPFQYLGLLKDVFLLCNPCCRFYIL